MKVELKLQPGLEQPTILIQADRETEELRQLVEYLRGLDLSPIPAVDGDRAILLHPGQVLRFYAEGKGVRAQTEENSYSVRLRLYELEQRLDSHTFVRISNSEIVNLKKVTALDLSLAGTIRMTLGGTVTTYVSRRYVKKIKQAIGL